MQLNKTILGVPLRIRTEQWYLVLELQFGCDNSWDEVKN